MYALSKDCGGLTWPRGRSAEALGRPRGDGEAFTRSKSTSLGDSSRRSRAWTLHLVPGVRGPTDWRASSVRLELAGDSTVRGRHRCSARSTGHQSVSFLAGCLCPPCSAEYRDPWREALAVGPRRGDSTSSAKEITSAGLWHRWVPLQRSGGWYGRPG